MPGTLDDGPVNHLVFAEPVATQKLFCPRHVMSVCTFDYRDYYSPSEIRGRLATPLRQSVNLARLGALPRQLCVRRDFPT